MEIQELVELVMTSERISKLQATEILNYGISEILKTGIQYSDALVVLERAQTAMHRDNMQRVTWGAGPSATSATDINE
tara:strand:- start:89 stop:322 length:234 start_codon:yes stop_codon:yes gene_type:complete